MAGQNFNAQRKAEYEESGVRRNLYLVDYEKTREGRSGGAAGNTYRRMDTERRQQARREAEPENLSASARGRVPVSAGNGREGAGLRPVRREEPRRRPVQGQPDERLARLSERERRQPGEVRRPVQGHEGQPDGTLTMRRSERERRQQAGEYRPAQGQMSAGRRPVRREEPQRRPMQGHAGQLDETLTMRRSERERRQPGEVRRPVQGHEGQLDETLTMRRSERERGQSGEVRRPGQGQRPACRRPVNRQPMSRRALEQRRKRVLLQRATILLWVLCIAALAGTFVLRINNASAAGPEDASVSGIQKENEGAAPDSGIMVQGLPAEEFAKHPDWKEDFLTPNEYSRPGEPLESITNIFVHYTANPGTSAAQNRSYFEQQKDTHENSVSSHFIIGYEGEIIQCVPLDEIAHAVMTRNYDSISIECCYLAEDGSFTPETYDSLISLLAWLVDAYDLQSSDILRHYDCGGKKCPLYYTDHEDKWEQLKKDVDKL